MSSVCMYTGHRCTTTTTASDAASGQLSGEDAAFRTIFGTYLGENISLRALQERYLGTYRYIFYSDR